VAPAAWLGGLRRAGSGPARVLRRPGAAGAALQWYIGLDDSPTRHQPADRR